MEDILSKNRKEYETFFESLKKELRNVRGMVYNTTRTHSKTPKKEFQRFEKFLGHPIPPALLEFYKTKPPFTISWNYQAEDSQLISGRTAIWSIEKLYAGPMIESRAHAKRGERHKNELWFLGDDPEKIKELEDHFYILDTVAEDGSNVYTLLKIASQEGTVELFLYLYPFIRLPLKLDFITYIKLAIETRGLFLWQLYFIDMDKLSGENRLLVQNLRPDRFFDNMKLLFPDADLSLFPKPVYHKTHSFAVIGSKKDYARRFETMAKDLKEKGEVEWSPHYVSPLLSILQAERVLNRSLPDSMLAFYSQLNGFRMTWNTSETRKQRKGAEYHFADVDMLALAQIFAGLDCKHNDWTNARAFDGLITFDSMDEEQLAFASQCRVITLSEYNTTVIRFVEGQEEPELYLFYAEDVEFYPLSLGFADYMECLLETRGLAYWEHHLIDTKAVPEGKLGLIPPFFEDMTYLFPEVDLSKYRD